MECILTVTDEQYQVSDEAYRTLKRIVKRSEALIKAYEKRKGKKNTKKR